MIATPSALEYWLCERSAENKERLVLEYEYLCARGARKFSRPGLDRADLKQIAAIGLLKACERYEPAMRTPFEAYAWLFIVGELMHFVRDHERLVRAPRRLRALEQRVHRAVEQLGAQLGHEPSTTEIAAHLNVEGPLVSEALLYRERSVVHSLDAASANRCSSGEADFEHLHASIVLEHALGVLTPVERQIIVALYSGGFSQSEVAVRLGYSRRHVSRLHRGALAKMEPLFVAAT